MAKARPLWNVPIASIGMLQVLKILKRRHVHIQAEAQYVDRNKLDLAIPKVLFPKIV